MVDQPDRIRLLYITAGDAEEAASIGRRLVEERLVACANVIDGMRSLYWWDGAVEEGREAILIVKTWAALVAAATQRIVELHSYDCACVLELPVEGGNPPFLEWVAQEASA